MSIDVRPAMQALARMDGILGDIVLLAKENGKESGLTRNDHLTLMQDATTVRETLARASQHIEELECGHKADHAPAATQPERPSAKPKAVSTWKAEG